VADRDLFQGAEAVPEGQNLRGDQRERREGADLDSIDRDAAAEVPPDEGNLEMEPVESGSIAPVQPVDLSGFVGVVECTLSDPYC